MTDSTIDEQNRDLFNTYTPFVDGYRSQITEWISGNYQGEFSLKSIPIQIQPPFKSLSEYYYSLTGKSLYDFFKEIEHMFPGCILGYRFNGSELSFYLTKS